MRNRSGIKPYAMSFGFSTALENPEPIDQRMVDADFVADYRRDRVSVQASAGVSRFDNHVHELRVDNPKRITDVSGGDGAAVGVLDLYPDNRVIRGSLALGYVLPRRTALTATLGLSEGKQNDRFLGLANNSALPQSSRDSLPAQSLDGKTRQVNADVRLTSRPAAGLDGTVHLRYSDYDNRTPVVNFALFRIRMFTFSILSLLLIATTSSVLMLVLPFYMQDVLRHSPSFIGVLFLAAPVFTITLAPIVGLLTDRIGPRLPASIGVVATMSGFLVGTSLGIDSHWLVPATLLALTGLGQGFFNTANQTALITSVPRDYRGFATGMVQMVFGLGALLGTALGTVLLTVSFRYASGIPDATPSAQDPTSFVFAMTATYAVCVALTIMAFVTSVMRGPAAHSPGARI